MDKFREYLLFTILVVFLMYARDIISYAQDNYNKAQLKQPTKVETCIDNAIQNQDNYGQP